MKLLLLLAWFTPAAAEDDGLRHLAQLRQAEDTLVEVRLMAARARLVHRVHRGDRVASCVRPLARELRMLSSEAELAVHDVRYAGNIGYPEDPTLRLRDLSAAHARSGAVFSRIERCTGAEPPTLPEWQARAISYVEPLPSDTDDILAPVLPDFDTDPPYASPYGPSLDTHATPVVYDC